MFHREWEVLLVDDEPDVLSISKLAMRRYEVFGLPLKIYTAGSKAETLELLAANPDLSQTVSVGFVDVVMETDTAGIDLCRHIREVMGNRTTQLYIRTGQPGQAPERTVIDLCDINGYFTKVEATEDKLYSLVKSGVRQYLLTRFSTGAVRFLNQIIAAADSREKLAASVHHLVRLFNLGTGLSPRHALDVHGCVTIGGELVFRLGLDDESALAEQARLEALWGMPLGTDGDKYVRDEENNILIKVAGQPNKAETCLTLRPTFAPPLHIVEILHSCLTGLAIQWKRAV